MAIIATKINIDRFDFNSMPESEFFKKHVRLDVKYHDSQGELGPEKYDYFLFVSKEEIENDGFSDVYILLLTPKSVDNMDKDKRIKSEKFLKRNNIHIDMIVKHGHVVYAIDSAATATCSSLFVPFTRRNA